MPTLFPPDYPEHPDAPLLSFGPSFSEEISRSVLQTLYRDDAEEPQEFDIRAAAGLTMLEGFHPRDHLECMIAAQGVALHSAIMETLRIAMAQDTQVATAIKLRANATQMCRGFSTLLRDIERRQAKPLPQRPGQSPSPPSSETPPDEPPPDGTKPRARKKAETAHSGPSPAAAEPAPLAGAPALDDVPDLPEDIETRPDGTPGSLTAYLPKPVAVEYVPRTPPIMYALATCPKPWRMVNVPNGAAPADPAPPVMPEDTVPAPPDTLGGRGPLDITERIFTGDSMARWAATRFDPDAPPERPRFGEDDDAVFELELISTGGDPEAEARRAELIAAHPEGKPIITFRYGADPPPDPPEDQPPVDGPDKPPPGD